MKAWPAISCTKLTIEENDLTTSAAIRDDSIIHDLKALSNS